MAEQQQPPAATTAEDDEQFVRFMHDAWLRHLTALGQDAETTEVLLDTVEQFLLGLREGFGVGADEVWRALIGGYTEAMTEGFLRAKGVKFVGDA